MHYDRATIYPLVRLGCQGMYGDASNYERPPWTDPVNQIKYDEWAKAEGLDQV